MYLRVTTMRWTSEVAEAPTNEITIPQTDFQVTPMAAARTMIITTSCKRTQNSSRPATKAESTPSSLVLVLVKRT